MVAMNRMDLRCLKSLRFGDVLNMWGKGDDEQNRKYSSLISSLCNFIS